MSFKHRNIPRQKMPINVLASKTQAQFQKAFTFHKQGQLAQAQAIYEEILKSQPKHFDSLHLLGVIAYNNKNFQKAAELIGKAIEIFPRNAAFFNNRGNALKELKQLEAAVSSYDQAITLKPDYADAYFNRGNALKELKQLETAVSSYDQAITLKPYYADAFYNRGIAHQELKQYEAAVSSYDRAISLKSDYAEAYNNRGNALKDLKQHEAAVLSYNRAIVIRSDYAEAYRNRGVALQELRQLEAAVASYDLAIALKPDYAEAYLNKSLTLLLDGNFSIGWELYEWRWKLGSVTCPQRDFQQPLWLGKESIAGKTILLHSEQGFGDTIQFIRYAQLVADLGARVIIEIEKPLEGLLKQLAGVSELVIQGSVLPPFDYYCPLLSLPLAFKTALPSIPCSKEYLRSNHTSKQKYWANKLGDKKKIRVGIVWSGSSEHKNDSNRSILLADFIQHLSQECQYVSLQKEIRDIDKSTLQCNPNILHFGEELQDFSDTAAICELLDLVICVDTSVAHLCGAMGKATWVLLAFCPDWRWLLERDDSPWYPSVKLYRQPSIGDWGSVLENVSADLEKINKNRTNVIP